MRAPRSRAAELVRALDGAAIPVYLVDAARRIVFVNEACRRWLGPRADDLPGQECRYTSQPDESGEVPLAGLLCPPPEAFSGQPVRRRVIVSADDPQAAAEHEVEFVPLAGAGAEPAAIVAIVSPVEAAAAEITPAEDEPTAEQLHARLQAFRARRRERFSFDRLVGDSPAMRRVRAQATLAAGSNAATLIVGPTGSRRLDLARAVHYARRSAGALLPLECALLGAELLQANLRALARPHASAERPATLVLQDVDEMPLEAQAELAGFVRLVDLPVKIVSTARRMLIELAEVGQFRYDLACALSTIAIELVPLADRLDDLPLAAQWQLERANAAGAKQLAGFSSEALDRLAAHDWPGDVGELAEVVAEAHARAEGGDVQLRDLPLRLHQASDAARFARPPDETIVLETFLGEIEHELIERALSRAKGNKAQAARLLGMTRPRLYRRLVQLGFEEPVIFEEEVEE